MVDGGKGAALSVIFCAWQGAVAMGAAVCGAIVIKFHSITLSDILNAGIQNA